MPKAKKKKNPLSKAQNQLLRQSLQRLLGDGLIREEEQDKSQVKKLMLRDALNTLLLE